MHVIWSTKEEGPEKLEEIILSESQAVRSFILNAAREMTDKDAETHSPAEYNRALAETLYTAIEKEGIRFNGLQYDFSQDQVPVQMPSAIIDEKEKYASSADLTVLAAACLHAAGVSSELLFMKKHMFVGIWLEIPPEGLTGYQSAEGLYEAYEKGLFLPFELTTATDFQGISFEKAVFVGKENLPSIVMGYLIPGSCSHELTERKYRMISSAQGAVCNSIGKCESTKKEKGKTEKKKWQNKNFFEVQGRILRENQEDFFDEQLIEWYEEAADFREGSPLLDQAAFAGDQIEVRYDSKELCSIPLSRKKGKEYSYHLVCSGEGKKAGLKKTLLCLSDKKHTVRAINTMLEKSRLAADRKYGIYFCVGQMCWTDAYAGKSHYAPLYLIPVELVNNGTEYFVKPDPGKIILNENLIQFMKKVYHLNLKPVQTEITPEILHGICEKIEHFDPSWKLDPDKGWIGYQEPVFLTAWERLTEESCGNGSTILRQMVSGTFPEKETEAGTVHAAGYAFELNSQQKKAVDHIRRNSITRISGPSKSGKTRTAAAAAVDQLYRGKRVLYLSSDEQDLEQFRKNISEAGIGQYCLTIGADTEFQEICNQMSEAAADRKKQIDLHEADDMQFSGTSQAEEKLEEFYREMNRIGESGYSLNELFEQYESCRNAGAGMDFSVRKEVFQIPGASELIREFMELQTYGAQLQELYQENTDPDEEEQENLQLLLPGTVDCYDQLQYSVRQFYRKLGISLKQLAPGKRTSVGIYLAERFQRCINIEVSEPELCHKVMPMFEKIILADQLETMQKERKDLQEEHHFKDAAFAVKVDSIRKLQSELAAGPRGENLFNLRKELEKILVIKQKTLSPAQQKEFCDKFQIRLGKLAGYYEKYPNEQLISVEEQEQFLSLCHAEKKAIGCYIKSLKEVRSTLKNYGCQDDYKAAAAGLRKLAFSRDKELMELVKKISTLFRSYRELKGKIEEIMPVKKTFESEHPEMAQAELFRIWMDRDGFEEKKKRLRKTEVKLLAAGLKSICEEFRKEGLSAEEACEVYRKYRLRYCIDELLEQPVLNKYSREMLQNLIDQMNREIREQYRKFQKVLLLTVRGNFFHDPDAHYETKEAALEAVFQAFPCIAISMDAALYYQSCICRQYDMVILDHAERLSMADGIPLLAAADRLVLLEDDKLLESRMALDTCDGLRQRTLLSQESFRQLPPQKLLWNYGSREQNAVCWKNVCIWDDQLISLPSREEGDCRIHVESVPVARCDSSRDREQTVNMLEAQQIVSDIVELYHAREKGSEKRKDIRTCVVTANKAQACIVEKELKRRPEFHEKDGHAALAEITVLPLSRLRGQRWDYVYYSPVYGVNFDDKIYFPEEELKLFTDGFYALLEAADTRLYIVTGLTDQIMEELLDRVDTQTAKVLDEMLFHAAAEQEKQEKYSILTRSVTDILTQKGYNIEWKKDIVSNSFSVLSAECSSPEFHGAIVIENQIPDGFTYSEMLRQIPELLHENGWDSVEIVRWLDVYGSSVR